MHELLHCIGIAGAWLPVARGLKASHRHLAIDTVTITVVAVVCMQVVVSYIVVH